MTGDMRSWMQEQGLTYRSLAAEMGLSATSVWQKVHGDVQWQLRDLVFFHDKFGLSSDFVLGLDGEAERADTQLEVA